MGSAGNTGSTITTTTTVIGSAVGSSTTNNNNNSSGNSNGNVSTTITISNVGSSSNINRDNQISNIQNSAGNVNNNGLPPNFSDVPQNFGSTGSLAIREVDVVCPICDAVSDKSYNEGLRIDVGEEMWTCGYLQETVQDTDQYSIYDDVAMMCRQSQILAEEGGCCGSNTMYINTPGEMLNNPCNLCDWRDVPDSNLDKLVNTRVVGSHTCGGLEYAMMRGVFSSNMCPLISANIKDECCFVPYDNQPLPAAPVSFARSRSAESPLLRGAALTP